MTDPAITARLEALRVELRAERMSYGELSYGELHELQSLAEHIDPDDVELLEAAGVPECHREVVRTTFTFTVLHSEDLVFETIEQAVYEASEGDAVGDTIEQTREHVHPALVSDALAALGNDGAFFGDES